MTRTVDAVLLAAGRSTRMGEPKPLLEIGGETFLERAIRVLREGGCRYVVAVLNDGADWAQRLADTSGAAVVVNPDPLSEQLDSLRLALPHVPADADGIAVLPVDFPRLTADTVTRLVQAFAGGDAQIVLPEHNGETGHPVLLGRSLFGELEKAELPNGVRSLLEARAAEIERVSVDDPGVLLDVDTPADLRRVTGEE
jgi:molybdenum cofactor cytidylyltransferase